jgi:cell division protein FtsW
MIKFNRGNGIISDWWWTVDRISIISLAIIMGIGMMLVMAASPAVAERLKLDSFFFVKKQIIFAIVSAFAIFFLSAKDHIFARRFSVIGLLITLFMLIYVEFAGFETKGAKLWINIGGISLQPAEFVKPFLAVVTAWLLSRSHTEANFPGFLISLILYGIFIGLIVKQPDFGMAAVITAIWATQVFVAGLNFMIVIALGVIGVVGVIAAYNFVPHVRHRVEIYLDPSKGDSFQNQKSLEAFKNGGLFGTGPGQGEVKNIIPDCHTDFIFSVAGEELGTIICIMIVSLFAFVVIRCFLKILKEKDLFRLLAGTGLIMQFAVQSVVNMSVALSLIPNTGLTLPLVSYGGSSMLSAAICVGMLLAITRRKYGEQQ